MRMDNTFLFLEKNWHGAVVALSCPEPALGLHIEVEEKVHFIYKRNTYHLVLPNESLQQLRIYIYIGEMSGKKDFLCVKVRNDYSCLHIIT